MTLEERLLSQGRIPLCGVDEAGRGPLAGPVVAAAVIMDPQSPLRSLVRDSKGLSPRRREHLFGLITNSPQVWLGYAMVDAARIDEINILQATLQAMAQAVSRLGLVPACVLVDGTVAPTIDCECLTVVRGDVTEPSISAASIVAKVVRDRHMIEMDGRYPGYGFSRHKGYPTRAHYEAIRTLGVTPIHRRSFRGVTQEHAGQGPPW